MLAEERGRDYNEERPPKSLGYLSPLNYLRSWKAGKGNIVEKAGLATPASENNLSFEA